MKVAVTGASGFVGSELCKVLGERAIALPRDASLPPASEAMVHLAGIAHRAANDAELRETNVRLAERRAREAAALGIPFVFISSVKVHGDETSAPLTERSSIRPADRYGESKARAEEALHAIAGLRLTVLRPPLVYGPGVKANFLALMRAVARGWPLPLASIENRRSLIFVGNLADAIVRSIGQPGTFLLSDGAAVSTPQLCQRLGRALGRPARLFPFPPAFLPRKLTGSLEVDDSAIRALGWQPRITAEMGTQLAADWLRGRRR